MMRAYDEPVYDGDWVKDNNTTTYWSPLDVIENSPWYEKEPFYEDSWCIGRNNHQPYMF